MKLSSSSRLLVVGVGLIGGSLALSLKKSGVVGHVTGFGRRIERLENAVELGVLDDFSTDLEAAASRADVIFIGTPVGAMPGILKRISSAVRADAVVTDGGSTKVGPLEAARSRLGVRFCRFVPAHPVAGSERSGVEAARAELYRNHKVLLTPVAETDADAVDVVEHMWLATGATVEHMSATEHDRILGLTSHLPHVLAYVLVDFIARNEDASRCFDLVAGGFLDFTRIASSDPEMWRDICMENADSLSASLGSYIEALEHVKRLIESGQAAAIEQLFTLAREAREGVVDNRKR